MDITLDQTDTEKAIGLIDQLIFNARVLAEYDLTDAEIQEALVRLREDENVRAVCGS